jgi:hypothetical protein
LTKNKVRKSKHSSVTYALSKWSIVKAISTKTVRLAMSVRNVSSRGIPSLKQGNSPLSVFTTTVIRLKKSHKTKLISSKSQSKPKSRRSMPVSATGNSSRTNGAVNLSGT